MLTAAEPDYGRVHAIFQKHCLDCHNAKDAEGQLIMESYDLLMKGGETGAGILPGNSSDSLLVQMIEGRYVKDGKTKIMPPGQKRKKLEPSEIVLIRSWIDAGAKGPATPGKPRELVTPKIPLKTQPRSPVNALAFDAKAGILAVARHSEVELQSIGNSRGSEVSSRTSHEPGPLKDSRDLVTLTARKTLGPHRGAVNALALSGDGSHLFAAAGEPGLFGEVRQWKLPEGELVAVLEGHLDNIYSMVLSPDGKRLATGSYDQKIKLWNVAARAEMNTLTGHNGAVFGLAFRPDGKVLASASADRTVKLWNVETGQRTDTLSQPLKEQYAVVFSRDGKRLFAAGADNRIRAWQISDTAVETTNPLLESRFAHEGSVLRLALSPDGQWLLSAAEDRTVRLWDAASLTEKASFEPQPDWPNAICFVGDGKQVGIGRADGSLGFYDVMAAPVAKTK